MARLVYHNKRQTELYFSLQLIQAYFNKSFKSFNVSSCVIGRHVFLIWLTAGENQKVILKITDVSY